MIDRFLLWLVNKIGAGTLLTLALLMAATGTAAFGLANLIQDIDQAFLWAGIGLGTLAGWLLGNPRLAAWKSALAGLVLLLVVNLVYFGKLLGPLIVLIGRLRELSLALLRWRTAGPPDPGSFWLAAESAYTSLSAVLGRVFAWANYLVQGTPIQDPLPVALVWSLAIWGAALWAAWIVRRRELALPAVLPAAAVLAAVMNYKRADPLSLAILLGLALWLMLAASHRNRQRHWETQGLDYPSELQFDLALTGGPLVIFIVLAAFILPSISIKGIVERVQRWAQPQSPQIRQVGRSLGLGEPGSLEVAGGLSLAPGLPRSHLLGSSPDLSRRMIMTVRTADRPPGPPESISMVDLPNYHWRSATYEKYTGRGWENGEMETVENLAGELAVPPRAPPQARETLARLQQGALPGVRLVWQEVRAAVDLGEVLYAAGTFLTSSHDTQVLWRKASTPAQQEAVSGAIWPEGGDLFGVKVKARQYWVQSLLPAVSKEELRQAGEAYPPAIAERYLDLPPGVPERVIALAKQVSAGATDPYQKASAIEAYLREIPYSLEVPPPPAGRDVADYFLFDLRQGYCDYYATAMVVMARSVGLPARLVIGYARGAYNPYQAHFVVTAADAHSWVEIYFPGIGWIEFEPTGSQPPIERPETPALEGLPQASAIPPTGQMLSWTNLLRRWLNRGLQSPAWLAGIALLLAALAWNTWLRFDAWRLSRLSPAKTLHRIFQHLVRAGQRLVFPPAGATPYEMSALIAGEIERLSRTRLAFQALDPALQDVHQITELYAHAAYGPRQPGPREKYIAIMAWNRLKWKLWVSGVVKRIDARPSKG